MKLARQVGRRSSVKMLFEDRLQLLFVDRLGQKSLAPLEIPSFK